MFLYKKSVFYVGLFFVLVVLLYVRKDDLVAPRQTIISQADNSSIQTAELMQQLKKLDQSVQDLNKRIAYLESGSLKASKKPEYSNFDTENIRPSADLDSIQILVDEAKVKNKQRIVALQNQLEEEQINLEWAGRAEQSIQKVISSFSEFSETPIECKTSICRLEVYYDKPIDLSKFLQKLALKTGHILPLMNTQYFTENEQSKVIVFLSERNEG